MPFPDSLLYLSRREFERPTAGGPAREKERDPKLQSGKLIISVSTNS